MGKAWNAAVNAELVNKLKALAEEYDSEPELFAFAEDFGKDVYAALNEAVGIDFSKDAGNASNQ